MFSSWPKVFSVKFSTAFTVFLTKVKMQIRSPMMEHKNTVIQINLFDLLFAKAMIPKISDITVNIKQMIPNPINSAAVKNIFYIIKECYRVFS
ncbi:MAG: hypothetical protein C0448_10940 [Sphingobacteriaceae bacterium]|nr:hypothetical protein [Sphingobacteriaceae bacterium]